VHPRFRRDLPLIGAWGVYRMRTGRLAIAREHAYVIGRRRVANASPTRGSGSSRIVADRLVETMLRTTTVSITGKTWCRMHRVDAL